MGAIAATVSYMETMDKTDQERVRSFAEYTSKYSSHKNPFAPITEEQVLADLAISDKEYHEGKAMNFEEAIMKVRREHGFI